MCLFVSAFQELGPTTTLCFAGIFQNRLERSYFFILSSRNLTHHRLSLDPASRIGEVGSCFFLKSIKYEQ